MPFARWCYTALFFLALPFVVARLWWRGRKAPAYRRRIGERFGFFASLAARDIAAQYTVAQHSAAQHAAVQYAGAQRGFWVHAVSVGEMIAAAPLIRELQSRYPQLPITVTTMTPTGSERVRALFGDSVFHVYAPYDLPLFIALFLRRVRPRCVLIMETELWPNTVRACARRGIPVLLANARLSQKSAAGYARFAALTRPMLRDLAKVVAQNAADGARFVALGLPPERLTVSGSIKFDLTLAAELRQRAAALKTALGGSTRPIWIAASTHAGEDEIALHAHRLLRARHADALLILVPRHPERFDAVAKLIEQQGFGYRRHSQPGAGLSADAAVLLGDTMGELLLLYGCADVAFVGGSFVERGGHNMLEPAAWALPVLTGPSDFNFREISALLQAAGALRQCDSAEQLADQVEVLFSIAAERQSRGAAAQQVVEANRGALEKLLVEIDTLLNRGDS